MKEECTEITRQKLIVLKEKKRKSHLIVANPRQLEVMRVEVDDCQIDDDSLRCDYFFQAKETEHYVELKGENVPHAMKQLRSTIKQLSADRQKAKKVSFIICTRSPMNAAAIQNERAKFRKHYNSDLAVLKSGNTYRL